MAERYSPGVRSRTPPASARWLLAATIVTIPACEHKPVHDTGSTVALAESARTDAPAVASSHDPSHPPIDCPLRKAGIDPHGLKPFEDTEKYIAFLERPDRVVWQKPDAVVASLGLTGTETIADVGAGSGYFTFRFAQAVPRGRVIATDIEPEMIRHIHHKAMSEGVGNVQTEFGEADDPKVPTDASVVFVCDVLHHVRNQSVWLSKMYGETKAGARVVFVEFKEGELPQGPPAAVKMPLQQVVDLVTAAGFVKVSEDSTLLPYQYVLTFRKAG